MSTVINKSVLFIRSEPLLYPFMFAIYPILALWSANIQELSVFSRTADLLLPIVAIEIFTSLLLGCFWLMFRLWRFSGLCVAFVLLLFFSYGHVLQGLAESVNADYAKDQYLIPAWIGIFAIGSMFLFRLKQKAKILTNPLNVTALVLIVFTLPNTLFYNPPSAVSSPGSQELDRSVPETTANKSGSIPDIWYITAEGYSSPKVITKTLGADLTGFISFLRDKGFYIAEQSNSNYPITQKSLASSLNMQPIHQLLDEGIGTEERGGLYATISDNKAMRFARLNGYKIVYLADRFPVGREELGDTYYGCGARRLGVHVEGFTDALLMTTALNPILTNFQIIEPGLNDLRVCTFLQLAKATQIPGPKIVGVHLNVPGYPFVVGPAGEVITNANSPERYAEAYRGQLAWTNERLEWLINIILADSDRPPVIVIQGDHGESAVTTGLGQDDELRAKFRIMNAYHLPDGGDNLLYPSISPVNTFRLIFNRYLGADFDLHEDRSYLRDLTDVTDVVEQEFEYNR